MGRKGFFKFSLSLFAGLLILTGCAGRREGTNTSITRVLVEGVVRSVSGTLVNKATVLDLVTGDQVEVLNGVFSIEAARSEVNAKVELLVSSVDREDIISLEAETIDPETQKFALEISAKKDGFEATKVEIVEKEKNSNSDNDLDPLIESKNTVTEDLDDDVNSDKKKKTPKMSPPLVADEPSETPTPEMTPPPTEEATEAPVTVQIVNNDTSTNNIQEMNVNQAFTITNEAQNGEIQTVTFNGNGIAQFVANLSTVDAVGKRAAKFMIMFEGQKLRSVLARVESNRFVPGRDKIFVKLHINHNISGPVVQGFETSVAPKADKVDTVKESIESERVPSSVKEDSQNSDDSDKEIVTPEAPDFLKVSNTSLQNLESL